MRGGNEGEALYRWADPVARGGATPLSPAGGATGPPGGPTGLSPLGGRQGPVARWGATGPPLFFLQELRCKFEEKKLHLSPIAPLIGRPGYIFEIFQNRHIFLKF